MMHKKTIYYCWVLMLSNALVYAQGTFQNLNFEASTVSASQPSATMVDIAAALPAWVAYIGTNPILTVRYNDETIGSAGVSLLGTNNPFGQDAIEGRFSVLLQAGTVFTPPSNFTPTEVSLKQTGLIPLLAKSIQFKAFQNMGTTRPFTVSIAGLPVSLIPLQVMPNYTLYGADVTPFENQVQELQFTALSPDGGLNNLLLDSILFSTQSVPEPSTLSLFGLGALLFSCRSRLGTRS